MSTENPLGAERDALPEVSVVLPAHNEIGLLGSTVTNLATGLGARGRRFELIVVENGSKDGTGHLARLLAAQMDEVRVVELEHGDYGAALLAGFQAARARLVVNFDVDYYDFKFLDEALSTFSDSSPAVVLASKRAPGARDGRPLVRRAMTYGFAALLKGVVGLETTDAHGMKVLDRAVMAPIVAACVLRGSLFDVEMIVRASRAGLSILEIPAVVAERRPPRSSPWKRAGESALGIFELRRELGRGLDTSAAKKTTKRSSAPARAASRLTSLVANGNSSKAARRLTAGLKHALGRS